jgi:FtsH-binding integral membrane protein
MVKTRSHGSARRPRAVFRGEAMRELSIVVGIFGLGALLSGGVAYVAEGNLLESGWLFMIQLSLVAIVCELVYFGGLFAAARPALPKDWYQRSFEHHHLLSVAQKFLVLPFFYVGAILLTLSFLLSLILAFAAFQAAF